MPNQDLQPDRECLIAHIREFARRVKLSGTREELESFLHLKDRPVSPLPMPGERSNLNDKSKADPVIAAIGEALKGKTVGVVQSTSHAMTMSVPAKTCSPGAAT